LARSRANLETAERLAEELGDDVRRRRILSSLVYTLGSLGDLVRAVEVGEHALALAERQSEGDVWLRANMMLARAWYGRGDYERAIVHATHALDLLRASSGDGPRHEGYVSFGRVNARIWLVLCLAELGRFEEAIVFGQEATDIALQVNGPEELIWVGLGMGRMHLVRGNLGNTVESLEPALALCKSAEFPIYFSRVASSLGAAYALLGRIDDGLVLLEDAIRQAVAINFMFGRALVLSHFGRACHLAGRKDEAIAHARKAIDLAQTTGARGNEGWAWHLLGDLVFDGNSGASTFEQAENHYRTALLIADELGMRPLRAHCLYGLSRVHGNRGNQALMEEYATDAARLCREMGMQPAT
jgi:tetratricopeptide (TPR) repeat protein